MSNVTITRVTHSCVLLDFEGTVILTDPWFSERPGYLRGEPLAYSVAELPRLDAVICSHAHYDHYDLDAFKAYRDLGVRMIVKRGMGAKARAAGFRNVTEVEPWERVEVGSVTVTAAPAKHAVPEISFVLEGGGLTVFFGADTLLIPELTQLGARYPVIDVALLPVNGLCIRPLLNRQVVMNAVEAARLCGVLRPRFAIPIHYKFTAGPMRDRLVLKYTGTAEEFAAAAATESPETDVRILAPGQPLTVSSRPGAEPPGGFAPSRPEPPPPMSI